MTKGSNVTLWTFSLQDKKGARFNALESSNPIGSVFSPDGRWVAYSTSERPGNSSATVYVQPFPPTGAKYQISKNNEGHHPIWSPDGKELFFEPGQNQFVVVAVQTQPAFTFGNPVSLPGGSFGSTAPVIARNRDKELRIYGG